MYAYAFVQFPVDTLPDTKIALKNQQNARAKRLYLRGRSYLFRALELRHPGIVEELRSGNADSALMRTTDEDTTLLYWTGAAWMGAFTADVFDMALAVERPRAAALVKKALELNDAFGAGSAHEFFVSYYGGLPASMGGSEERAREHFARAVALSDTGKVGPFVSLAGTVCISRQDTAEYKTLLRSALEVDLDRRPGDRLANILGQRRARWMLNNIETFFLLDPPVEDEEGGDE
jgi:predicted anti-sigma-YlaC factor YlaD